MPDVLTNPREQIADAVEFERKARHHPDCRCGMYRDEAGAPFCTSMEKTWWMALSRLIDQCNG